MELEGKMEIEFEEFFSFFNKVEIMAMVKVLGSPSWRKIDKKPRYDR
jgi:hypothetical protein